MSLFSGMVGGSPAPQRKSMRTNYFIWAGVLRPGHGNAGMDADWVNKARYPTVVIDMDLRSWALPFAVHCGGPLIGKPGFHLRVGPVNIGWSRL